MSLKILRQRQTACLALPKIFRTTFKYASRYFDLRIGKILYKKKPKYFEMIFGVAT